MKSRKRPRRPYSVENMSAAIKKVREMHASVNSAAKEFQIPEATLRWRLKHDGNNRLHSFFLSVLSFIPLYSLLIFLSFHSLFHFSYLTCAFICALFLDSCSSGWWNLSSLWSWHLSDWAGWKATRFVRKPLASVWFSALALSFPFVTFSFSVTVCHSVFQRIGFARCSFEVLLLLQILSLKNWGSWLNEEGKNWRWWFSIRPLFVSFISSSSFFFFACRVCFSSCDPKLKSAPSKVRESIDWFILVLCLFFSSFHFVSLSCFFVSGPFVHLHFSPLAYGDSSSAFIGMRLVGFAASSSSSLHRSGGKVRNFRSCSVCCFVPHGNFLFALCLFCFLKGFLERRQNVSEKDSKGVLQLKQPDQTFTLESFFNLLEQIYHKFNLADQQIFVFVEVELETGLCLVLSFRWDLQGAASRGRRQVDRVRALTKAQKRKTKDRGHRA